MANGGIISGLSKKGLGTYQFIEGKQMEEQAGMRPKYQAPEEVLQGLNMMQRAAYEGLPEEQKRQFIENLQAMQTTSLMQMSDRKAGLFGVGKLSQSATEGYRGLLSEDVTARIKAQQGYVDQLNRVADYRDIEYQQNELYPWQEQTEYARALQGAGMQTTMQGQAESEGATREVMRSVFGGGGGLMGG